MKQGGAWWPELQWPEPGALEALTGTRGTRPEATVGKEAEGRAGPLNSLPGPWTSTSCPFSQATVDKAGPCVSAGLRTVSSLPGQQNTCHSHDLQAAETPSCF